jgi:NADPH-dependent 2,4-dienoyl-CoA reductase/sulfur reductase-like enzyme
MGKVTRRAFLAASAAATAALTTRVRAGAAGVARTGAARVLIVGGGFAGAACALELRALTPALEVLLVDPDEPYVTCPMSNSVIAGLRTMSSITVSRPGLARAGVQVIRDTVTAIDPGRRQVRLRSGAALAYDRLVLAAGIRFLWGHPEGYSASAAERLPHAWQAGAQTQLLAAQLAALRPGGVVALSVPAGPMRCPPGPFERASLMAAYLARRGRRAKVLIFDANNHFPRQDAFSAAWQELYPGTIEWIPVTEGGALERVDPERMTLYSPRGAERADLINIIPPRARRARDRRCVHRGSDAEGRIGGARAGAAVRARPCRGVRWGNVAAVRDGQRLLQPARAGSSAVHSRALHDARRRAGVAARRTRRRHGKRAGGGAKCRVVVSAHRRRVVRVDQRRRPSMIDAGRISRLRNEKDR